MYTQALQSGLSNSFLTSKGISSEPISELGDVETNILKGIELSLFSYRVSLKDYESTLKEVCNTHFQYQILSVSEAGVMTVYISPEDYCLVDGGMMYKSAGSIISELVKRSLLIKGMRTVED